MARTLLGLCGPQGVGKSTLAELLAPYGFIRTRFARPLKSMLWHFLIGQGVPHEVADRMLDGDLKEVPTDFLEGRTPRHAMQTLGTAWRETISRDLWINAWERSLAKLPNNSWVVDDMRFKHEEAKVRSLDGKIILVTHSGFGPGQHQSEREYLEIKPDYTVMNDRNLDPGYMLAQALHFLEIKSHD